MAVEVISKKKGQKQRARHFARTIQGEPVDNFETFWALYPRKIAKGYARKIFARLSAEQQFAALQALPIHIRYWKIAGRSWDFLPHASTWLNGECWADELELPDPETATDPSWHKTTIGIERKAREVGVTPRPGEDWHTLKARVLAKMKEAA